MAQAYKTALLGQLGIDDDPTDPRAITPGIAARTTQTPVPDPVDATPAAPIPATPATASPFQSENRSVRGYLDEAVRSNAGKIKGIADEAGRKAANEQFLTSLIPEIEARGGSISDIKGDKARVDGRLLDFYRDIEGAADPQVLDVTDEGQAMGGGMGGFDLTSDPTAAIQQALAALGSSSPNLQALLAQLGAA